MSKYIFLLGLSALFACTEGGKETGETGGDADTDTDADTDADTTPETTVEATLVADGVDVVITNGSGDYNFGIVQSGTSDNWTGEDCYQGYTTGAGDNLQFCHAMSSSGGSLTKAETLPLADGETLFYDGLPGSVGFYLEDSSGACYVWGDAASWWDAIGCTSL
jgi:hypothetical protein